MAKDNEQPDYLRALLVLTVAEREERLAASGVPGEKVEVLLARAGLSAQEISTVTGKGVDAVRKTLQRARK